MSETLTVLCWRWQSPVGYRSTFAPETVYALKEMLKRHLHMPYRLVCITDKPEEIKGVETMRLWDEGREIPSPFGRHNPSCYVRLKVFAPDAGKYFGPRLVSIDLDTVIVNDITPLFERDEDFVIWGDREHDRKMWGDNGKQWYNGSLWMLRTGTRPQVWTQFNPEKSPEKTMVAGHRGSDQGWLSYILGPNEATWGRSDGVYSYRKHIAPHGNTLPDGARLVSFHGRHDPWAYQCQHVKWIHQHYPKMEPVF